MAGDDSSIRNSIGVPSLMPTRICMICFAVLCFVVCSYLSLVLHVDSWTVLAFHGALALLLALLAKLTMNAYNSQRASSAVTGKKTQ